MDSSTSKTPKQSANGLNVGTWMPAEDDRLREAVAKHGTRWVVVASEVGTRNGDQCAKRWNENLNPELDHSPWCPVEDRVLLHLVELHGHNWKFIANKFFEKRAPLSLKNRNSYLKRRQKREEQARASQRQSQTPPDPLPPNSALYTTGMMSMADVPMSTPAPFPMTPEFSSPHGSPHSSAASMIEGDMARLASRTNSSTDFGDMFNPLATNTSAPQSPGSDPHTLLGTPGVSMAESPMSYLPDQMSWPSYADNSTAFALTPGGDINMAMNMGFDNSRVPMMPMNEFAALHTQSSNPEDTVEYSLTCPRNKLKSLVQHLVDAAMPGTLALGIAEEDQQMVLNLRLKRL